MLKQRLSYSDLPENTHLSQIKPFTTFQQNVILSDASRIVIDDIQIVVSLTDDSRGVITIIVCLKYKPLVKCY